MLRFLPFLVLIAVVVWWGVSLWQKRALGPGGGRKGPQRTDRPRGPDDDPDFLRRL